MITFDGSLVIVKEQGNDKVIAIEVRLISFSDYYSKIPIAFLYSI